MDYLRRYGELKADEFGQDEKIFEVAPVVVKKVVETIRANKPIRKVKGLKLKKLTEEEIKEGVVKLFDDGELYDVIADRFIISVAKVKQLLIEAGRLTKKMQGKI